MLSHFIHTNLGSISEQLGDFAYGGVRFCFWGFHNDFSVSLALFLGVFSLYFCLGLESDSGCMGSEHRNFLRKAVFITKQGDHREDVQGPTTVICSLDIILIWVKDFS